MNDDQLITALRETTATLTADVGGRADSLDELLHQMPRARRRRRIHPVLPALLAAGAVAASVLGVVGLAAQRVPARVLHPAGVLRAAGPYPPSQYFLAQASRDHGMPDIVVVRVSDGTTVGALPWLGTDGLTTPVLSPDGTRVYAAWGTNPAHLGYYDFASGRRVVLDTKPGILIGPAVSADGDTLAYEWSATLGDPEHSTSVVIRDLRSDATRVLRNAPAGPQVLSMALSPDGTKLAIVPTQTTNRPLYVVSTMASDAFHAPAAIATTDCGGIRNAEPRWTARGLYVLRFCAPGQVDLVAVDVAGGTAARIRQLSSGGITVYTPIPASGGDLFAISDESQRPPTTPVAIYDPRYGWSHRTVSGIDGLAEVTSE